MSALAQLAAARGYDVSGSDRAFDAGIAGRVAGCLRACGVRLAPQDGSGVSPETACVVVSSAIEADNPDLAAARAGGVPVLHRSAMLARLVEGRRVVAVTGTSGKSTVTAMIGWALEQAGADPTVVNGAEVPAWRAGDRLGNLRTGASDLCVIEADESDRTLNAYRVDWAVVTNVSHDHFDEQEARELFRVFAARARYGVVSAIEEPGLLRDFDPCMEGAASAFTCGGQTVRVPMPGRHNAENALLALAVCERMGYPPDRIAAALGTFPGLHRRLEQVGKAGGVTVVDDYAHNPAKIRAAWTALAQTSGRVVAVWRPHGYGPLKDMLDSLAEAVGKVCRPQDRFLVLPVYDAGGTADRSVHSGMLVDRLQAMGCGNAEEISVEAVPGRIADLAGPGDTVLVMGARDPGLPALARRVLAHTGRGFSRPLT